MLNYSRKKKKRPCTIQILHIVNVWSDFMLTPELTPAHCLNLLMENDSWQADNIEGREGDQSWGRLIWPNTSAVGLRLRLWILRLKVSAVQQLVWERFNSRREHMVLKQIPRGPWKTPSGLSTVFDCFREQSPLMSRRGGCLCVPCKTQIYHIMHLLFKINVKMSLQPLCCYDQT